jgi:hypothetical protein
MAARSRDTRTIRDQLAILAARVAGDPSRAVDRVGGPGLGVAYQGENSASNLD